MFFRFTFTDISFVLKQHNLHYIIFSFDDAKFKKLFLCCVFEDLDIGFSGVEINFENFKNVLENIHKEANYGQLLT